MGIGTTSDVTVMREIVRGKPRDSGHLDDILVFWCDSGAGYFLPV